MPLISTSTTTNKTLAQTQAAKAGSSFGQVLAQSKTAVSGAVSSAEQSVGGVVSSVETKAASLVSSAENAISSKVASFTSMFSGKASDFSKQLNGFFSSAFSDTSTSNSTTTNTVITDPVKTLLSSKNPATAGYRLTSGSGAPLQITQSGTVTQPDGTASLTSNQTQTLRNRFNLDDITNLPTTLGNLKNASGVSGVYTNLFDSVKGAVSSVKSVEVNIRDKIGSVVSTGKGYVTAAKNIVPSAKQAWASTLSEVKSDYSSMLSDIDTTASSFVQDFNGRRLFSSVNGTGSTGTTDPSVTLQDVNAMAASAKTLGCEGASNYTSDSAQTTAASLLVHQTSQAGLAELTKELMECGVTTGVKNDTTLTTLITSLGGKHLDITSDFLSYMEVPQTLNTPDYTKALLTDAALQASDSDQVKSVLSTIGTTPDKVITVKDSMSGTAYPTKDLGVLSNMDTGVISGLFSTGRNTSVLAAAMQGSYIGTDASGQLTV